MAVTCATREARHPAAGRRRKLGAVGVAALAGVVLAGCEGGLAPPSGSLGLARSPTNFVTEQQRGYVPAEGALEQIPVGSSQEQVLLVLGTPSTVATVDGEVFYYISQKAKKVMFMRPEIVDQRVIAVYFDPKDKRVTRVADYGLKEGKVFDFVSRTTPTGGTEVSLLGQFFNATTFNPIGSR